jgi:hypothetical protein
MQCPRCQQDTPPGSAKFRLECGATRRGPSPRRRVPHVHPLGSRAESGRPDVPVMTRECYIAAPRKIAKAPQPAVLRSYPAIPRPNLARSLP